MENRQMLLGIVAMFLIAGCDTDDPADVQAEPRLPLVRLSVHVINAEPLAGASEGQDCPINWHSQPSPFGDGFLLSRATFDYTHDAVSQQDRNIFDAFFYRQRQPYGHDQSGGKWRVASQQRGTTYIESDAVVCWQMHQESGQGWTPLAPASAEEDLSREEGPPQP